ncbi:MAG: 16S rRNA (guanine(966)-N(2))-methyltransferase RsmD [Deltaproteobacteria bacterium]|nr:16S rRNA (guanine(966)-N(2))-methyltransferase RsmD [Deltaproteobacteria bacterium]
MRIIAGIYGGRRLAAPKGERTRPTADRAKEALFSILGGLEGAHVLDLYAGTGAIGLEALSRGAARAVFVEKARPALEALDENLRALGIDGEAAKVLRLDVGRALKVLAEDERFDLIYADPPYELARTALPEVLGFATRGLSETGRLVLEHRHLDPSPAAPPGLALTDQRRYGEATLAFYGRST